MGGMAQEGFGDRGAGEVQTGTCRGRGGARSASAREGEEEVGLWGRSSRVPWASSSYCTDGETEAQSGVPTPTTWTCRIQKCLSEILYPHLDQFCSF